MTVIKKSAGLHTESTISSSQERTNVNPLGEFGYAIKPLRDEILQKHFTLGPKYLITTNHGIPLEGTTLLFTDTDPSLTGEGTELLGYIIGQGPNGDIFGYKGFHFKRTKEGTLHASGFLDVNSKAGGVGTAVEMMSIDFLDKVSNAYQMTVEWRVENYNLTKRVDYLKSRPGTTGSDPVIKSFDNERAAWQHLYGNQGVLGLTNQYKNGSGGHRLFFPNDSQQMALDKLGEIRLKVQNTINGEGRTVKVPVTTQHQESHMDIDTELFQKLQKLLG